MGLESAWEVFRAVCTRVPSVLRRRSGQAPSLTNTATARSQQARLRFLGRNRSVCRSFASFTDKSCQSYAHQQPAIPETRSFPGGKHATSSAAAVKEKPIASSADGGTQHRASEASRLFPRTHPAGSRRYRSRMARIASRCLSYNMASAFYARPKHRTSVALVHESELHAVYSHLAELKLAAAIPPLLRNLIACTGASNMPFGDLFVARLGVRDQYRSFLRATWTSTRRAISASHQGLPRIVCGRHPIADVGLHGEWLGESTAVSCLTLFFKLAAELPRVRHDSQHRRSGCSRQEPAAAREKARHRLP